MFTDGFPECSFCFGVPSCAVPGVVKCTEPGVVIGEKPADDYDVACWFYVVEVGETAIPFEPVECLGDDVLIAVELLRRAVVELQEIEICVFGGVHSLR